MNDQMQSEKLAPRKWERVEQAFRTGVAWLWTSAYWVPVLVLYVVSFRTIPDVFVQKAIRFWARVALKILGIQVDLVNPSTLEDRRPRVVVSNHQSGVDLLWGSFVTPPSVVVIGKKEIVYVPIFNLMWWAFRFIRIDRSNREKALASLEGVAEDLVRNVRSLVIAPEGTRSRDGSILPFKKGAFHIALKGGIPIYPIVVSGAYELLNRGSFIPKAGRIRVAFLDPIETQGIPFSEMDALIEKVRNQMIEALNRLKESGDLVW